MNLPSQPEIEKLHKKYAPTDAAFGAVYTHCLIVWAIAEQLIDNNKLQLDKELVRVGCMLHDIGVYKFEEIGGGGNIGPEYIQHGQFSYEILQAEGFPEVICRFGSHHTGVGLTKEGIIANNLPLPYEDFLAETPEERLVMYADKFNSKTTPPRFNTYDKYREYTSRFDPANGETFDSFAAEFGKPGLETIAQKFNQEII